MKTIWFLFFTFLQVTLYAQTFRPINSWDTIYYSSTDYNDIVCREHTMISSLYNENFKENKDPNLQSVLRVHLKFSQKNVNDDSVFVDPLFNNHYNYGCVFEKFTVKSNGDYLLNFNGNTSLLLKANPAVDDIWNGYTDSTGTAYEVKYIGQSAETFGVYTDEVQTFLINNDFEIKLAQKYGLIKATYIKYGYPLSIDYLGSSVFNKKFRFDLAVNYFKFKANTLYKESKVYGPLPYNYYTYYYLFDEVLLSNDTLYCTGQKVSHSSIFSSSKPGYNYSCSKTPVSLTLYNYYYLPFVNYISYPGPDQYINVSFINNDTTIILGDVFTFEDSRNHLTYSFENGIVDEEKYHPGGPYAYKTYYSYGLELLEEDYPSTDFSCKVLDILNSMNTSDRENILYHDYNQSMLLPTNDFSMINSIQIFQVNGTQIYSSEELKPISTHLWHSGIYIVRMQTPNGIVTQKIIKP